MKLQLCLLMLLLGVMYVQSARLMQDAQYDMPEEEFDVPQVRRAPRYFGRCDWPNGYCVYIKDPCSPGMVPCYSRYYCPLRTNKCCCWRRY